MRNEYSVQTSVCIPLDVYKQIQKLTILGKFRSKGEVFRQALAEFMKSEQIQSSLDEYDRLYRPLKVVKNE